MPPTEASVVIVTDDPEYAGALAAAVSRRFEVTIAESAREIPNRQSHHRLVVILDATGDSRIHYPSLTEADRLLVIGPDDPAHMIRAVDAGALGYVTEDAPFSEIEQTIDSLVHGAAIVPPFMLGALLRHVVEDRRQVAESLERLEQLTPREREVFERAARGLSHQDIGERLFISPATARTHLHRIFGKLGIHSRAELVALAAACGLSTTEEQ